MTDTLKVHIIPFAKDNYAYAVEEKTSHQCVVIDPGDGSKVAEYLKKHRLKLTEIWITHCHQDHIAGIETLKTDFACTVLGPHKEANKIPFLDREVEDLDLIHFKNFSIKVFELPGHTLGHVGYWFYNDQLFFCGDALFSLGCGKLFEGTYSQMWQSLCKIRSLPEDTNIYCGHEYTQDNALFAQAIDPKNDDLKKYAQEVKKKRKKTNPPCLCG